MSVSQKRIRTAAPVFAPATDLLRRHFTMQASRPADVGDVQIGELAPYLRNQLFTDGMVIRAVEARTLRRVAVEVIDQALVSIPVEIADLLMTVSTDEALRRRVVMRVDGLAGNSTPFAYAESYILTRRLPAQFLQALSLAAGGLGEALGTARVESRRELLWCGMREAPNWATAVAAGECLLRSYRILTGRRPAILVLEGFAVFAGE